MANSQTGNQVTTMDKKRTAYIPEVEKMKGLKPGQSALIRFKRSADKVEVTYTDKATGIEVTKEKYHFKILLISHPQYPHLEGTDGAEMIWETVATEAEQLNTALPELAQASDAVSKKIIKHFDKGEWEIQCRDDGKIKLWMSS